MSEKIVQLNEEVIKGEIRDLVRGSVEETPGGLLEAEAEKLTQAARYERSEQRQGYRSGHYSRNLTTSAGEVKLQVPRLKGITFETAIIEKYCRRETSVEETLTSTEYPSEHGSKIRMNNTIEWINREIRRRTRVVRVFPDGNSAFMLGMCQTASCS